MFELRQCEQIKRVQMEIGHQTFPWNSIVSLALEDPQKFESNMAKTHLGRLICNGKSPEGHPCGSNEQTNTIKLIILVDLDPAGPRCTHGPWDNRIKSQDGWKLPALFCTSASKIIRVGQLLQAFDQTGHTHTRACIQLWTKQYAS